MEEVSEKTSLSEEKIKEYLKKTPAVLIAVVSAIVTVMSAIIGYAGRLSNVAYLKYWNVDELYATLETKNVAYLAVNSVMWMVAITIANGIAERAVANYYHYSVVERYIQKQIGVCLKIYKSSEKQVVLIEKDFWSNKHATEKDFFLWKKIASIKEDLKLQRQALKELKYENRHNIWRWKKALIIDSVAAEAILFFTAWLSFTAVSLTELASITLLSFLQLALAFFYSYENTKNQRETLRKHSQESVFKKENLRLSERIKKLKKSESEQYEKNRGYFKVDFKSVILLALATIVAVLFVMPLAGFLSAKSQRRFKILLHETTNEMVVFHNEDTYILEEAEINENTITINTAKQRILKTNDIAFEKMTFDTVVKK